jgi:hypothetical protein
MMTNSRRLLGALLTSTLLGGAALAQEEGGGEGAAAAPEPAASATVSMGMGPFTKESYPEEYVNRPLTLVAGMVEGRVGLAYVRASFTDSMGMTTVSDATAMGVEAGYGITDQIEAGLSTGLGIDPEFEWSESLGLYAMYLALDQAQLDVAARVDVPLSFVDGADTFSGFVLGAPVRYLVMPQLAVYAGHGLLPIVTSDPSQVDLNLNVGVAFQAMPKLAVRLDTQPASIALSGDGNETSTYGDFIPVSLLGLYAISNKIDLVVQVAFPSLEDAGDLYAIGAGANVRL